MSKPNQTVPTESCPSLCPYFFSILCEPIQTWVKSLFEIGFKVPNSLLIGLTIILLATGLSLQRLQLSLLALLFGLHVLKLKVFPIIYSPFLDIIQTLIAYSVLRAFLPQCLISSGDETASLVGVILMNRKVKRLLLTLISLYFCYFYFHNTNAQGPNWDTQAKTMNVHAYYYLVFTLFFLLNGFGVQNNDKPHNENYSNNEASPKHSQDIKNENNFECEVECIMLGISHDSNNLLHSLIGNLSLLDMEMKLRKRWNETTEGLLKSALSSAEHLKYLCKQTFDVVSEKNIDKSFNYTELNLSEPLRRLHSMILPQCKRKNIRLEITLEETTPVKIKVDEDKLMQILLNLAGNAIKFTERGEISIGVSWKPDAEVKEDNHNDEEMSEIWEDDSFGDVPIAQKVRKMAFSSKLLRKNSQKSLVIGESPKGGSSRAQESTSFRGSMDNEQGVLIIWVIDTGCGISQGNLEKLFQKGSQVHENIELRRCGRGLGLWYTKHILQLMKGSIQVRSQLGLGTKFLVRIPCEAIGYSGENSTFAMFDRCKSAF